MFLSKLIAASTLALSVTATPFSLLALRSATELQYAEITVNNLSLSARRPTTVIPPPATVNGSSFTNTTVFNLNNDGTVTMAIGGTGIQYLYIALTTGLAQVTPPHTNYIPSAGVSRFYIEDTGSIRLLRSTYGDAYACNGGPTYDIFFGVPALSTENCLFISLYVIDLPEGTLGAWEYD